MYWHFGQLAQKMHLDLSAEFLLTLLATAFAATCSVAALLACEYFGNRRYCRAAPAVVAIGLGAAALLSQLFSQPNWLAGGCLIVGAVMGLVWLFSREGTRSWSIRLLQPKAIWAVLLCVSAMAARILSSSVLNSVHFQSLAAEIDLSDVPVMSLEAITDKGRGIALFHFKMNSADEEIQRFAQSNEKDHAQLIRLIEPNPASNCHGWVFTAGQYGIRDPEVGSILSDNDYAEVAQPQEGDLAIYRRGNEICHSGLVRIAEKHSPVLIESKWGPFGVYLHATAAQPFGGECRFYRSSRSSHTLAMRRPAIDHATASIASPVLPLH